MQRLIAILALTLWCFDASAIAVKGSVTADGRAAAGVLVTDGYTFTKSDAKGEFTLDANDAAFFISIVTPSGYCAPRLNGHPQIYIALDPKTKRYDFTLKSFAGSDKEFDLVAIGDPQPKTSEHLSKFEKTFIPKLRQSIDPTHPQIAIMLGDIVWDSPEKLDSMQSIMNELGIAVYPVIGNHDHLIKGSTDDECTANFRRVYGPTYYAFDIADCHFIILDNIKYHGKKSYEEAVDDRQIAWLERYLQHIPRGSRICIAHHAPVVKPWISPAAPASARHLLSLLKPYEVHFITGHTHLNYNVDVTNYATEHNVAQINGNLWHDTMNRDGTPLGVAIFSRREGAFTWRYQTFDRPQSYQMRVWRRGELKEHKDEVVAKIWNWDTHWSVVWYEDDKYRGSMPRFNMEDPDYTARLDSLRDSGATLAKTQQAAPTNSYFRARPAAQAKEIRIVATDRFGNEYTEQIELKK